MLADFKAKFDPRLLQSIKAKREQTKNLDERYAVFLDILEDFVVRGGKRLRPAFMYYGYLACGGKEEEVILGAARSVELLQAFLLMHDDLVDRSDLRRGKPAAHKLFEAEFERLGLSGDKEHFGRSVAMILGDLTHAFAYEALLDADLPSKRLVRARKLFDELMFETAYGWYVELLNTMGKEVEEKLILRTMEYVSARYTISGPLKLGAVLAGAEKETVAGLEAYGLRLGTAFQIQDDILGMFGEEEKVGKPVDSDMKEGKKTLLLVRLAKKLKGEEAARLWRVYGKADSTREDYEWLKAGLVKTGVLEEVRMEAKILAGEALEKLGELSLADEGEKFLKGIAEYIVDREI